MSKFKALLIFLSFLSFVSFSYTSFANTNETAGQYIKGSSITADIKSRFLADSDIKSLEISVKTHKGIVTLTGKVDTQEQIDKAIQIAKSVDGVTSVKNKLTLK